MQQNSKTDKIFIVDDDQLISNLYGQYLSNIGYGDVSIFDNGQDCINQLIQEPQVIFLDQNMDYLNGIEVLRKIKRFDPNIYVVFISGQEDMKTAIDSLKYGAFDYIIKGKKDLERIEEVLKRIAHIREQLNHREPGLLRKLLSLIV